jgi:uncharacterized protein YfaS (alpha-2-macroglobulin family)
MLRRLRPILGTAVLLLVACSSSTSEPEVAPPAPAPVPTLEIAGPAEALEDDDRVPLRAADLKPILAAVAAPGVQPREIVVQFARRVIDDGQLGEVTEGTVLTIEPAARGRLVFRTPRTLVFEPAGPLSPSTRYRVVLEAVDTRSGVLSAPDGEAWSTSFTTPKAELLEVRLVERIRDEPRRGRAARHQVHLELDFSGPVRPARVAALLEARVGSTRLTIDANPSMQSHQVAVRLTSPLLEVGARIDLSLGAGLHIGEGEGSAVPWRRVSVLLSEAPLVRVLAIRIGESTDGFHVDVICDDRSVDGYRGWWHDSVNYDWYEVSPRCMPTQEAVEAAITIDPPVAFNVVSARHGFRLIGDFQRGAHSIAFDGLQTRDGGLLDGTVRAALSVPVRSPQVSFATRGRYLPKSAWKSLTIRHLNVDEVELTVRHVPRRNLVFWLSGDREAADERTSDVLIRKTLAVRGAIDEETNSSIDVRALVPDAGAGVYELTVAADGERDASRLLVTDLQLVAKASAARPNEPYGRSIPVWALDAHTTEPRSGVEVEAVRRSGTILASCVTGADGGCVIELDPTGADGSSPVALIASTKDDLTYLKFDDLRIDPTESQTAGEAYLSETPYRVSAWTDRGVYRPGETIHLAALVRDADHKAPPEEMPISLAAVDPRGNVVRSRTVRANPAGMLTWDVELSDFATTGAWALTLTAGDQELAREVVMVEEFVPERMEASAKPAAPGLLRGDRAEIEVSARYLFGGSAEGSPVELSCEIAPAVFAPEAAAEWTFGRWRRPDDRTRPIALGNAVGELGPDGVTVLDCPGADAAFDGTGRLGARAAVFEAGSGRSTQVTTSTLVHPARHYIGLQTGTAKAASGSPINVQGRVVDWDGAAAEDAITEVEVQLVHLEEEFGWLYDEEEDTESYRRYLREVGGSSQTVRVTEGRFTLEITPRGDASAYLVRAEAGGAVSELRVEGTGRRYWWFAGETDVDQTPRPKRPGTITLDLPEQVAVGARSEVAFTAPYRGRALITVETHEVLDSTWIDVEPGPVTHEFAVAEFVPNVYVSVLLLKDPHLESQQAYVPDRAFGTRSVRVEPKEHTLPLTLVVPDEVRPNSTLGVEITVTGLQGKTYVTVAAVDQGILQLTRFEDPDPLADVFAARRLGVDTFETVGWSLLLPPSSTSSSEGGGADGGELGRVQMTRPVALWSGMLEVPSNGKLTIPLDIPTFRGRLRVMVVAADAHRMAGASASVVVRDPLVLQATLPRFLSRGDRIRLPVFVTNTTPDDRDVVVTLAASEVQVPGLVTEATEAGPIRIHGRSSETLELAPGRSGTVVFDVEALASVGAARFRVEASSKGLETSFDEVDVPFLPRGPRERIVTRVELDAGDLVLGSYLKGWVPTTEQTTFWVTTNPYGLAFDHLAYLVRYPYGCVEQTSSQTRTMVFAGQLIDDIDASLDGGDTVADLVEHGIARILSMQVPEGGFAYWPGGSSSHSWGTVYALHTLLDAAGQGYDVPQVSIDRALTWLERSLPDRTDPRRIHYGEAYGHYVLALAERGRPGRLRTLIAELPADVRSAQAERAFLLKSALWLAGDRRYDRELRSPDLSPITNERRNDPRFYSDLRFRGLQLTVITDLFGRSEAPGLEQLVAAGLSGRSGRFNTQEIAWSLTGLGKRLDATPAKFGVPVLKAGSRIVEPTPVKPGDDTPSRSWTLGRASEYPTLTLTVPSKGDGALFLLISSEGVREDATWDETDHGVDVSRYFTDVSGRKLDLDASPDLGDLLQVVVTVRNMRSQPIPNLAVVDRLPAGFEIENPRLGRERAAAATTGKPWKVESMNLRDDRIELFGTLPAGAARTFTYSVRAVTSGTFTLPPVEAEAMYDPTVSSRESGGFITIQGPWGPAATDVAPDDSEGSEE